MKKSTEYQSIYSDIIDSETTTDSDKKSRAEKKTGISYLPWEQDAQKAEIERLLKIRKEKTLVILFTVFLNLAAVIISVSEKSELFLIFAMIVLLVCFLLRFVFLKRPLHMEFILS